MRANDLLVDDLNEASFENVFEALQGFVDETDRVDFKENVPDNASLAQLACAFANAYGGLVVIGIKDPDKSPDGLTLATVPPDISNRAQTGLLSAIYARTFPAIRCESFAFSSSDGHAILIIRTPRSEIGPHQSLSTANNPLPVRRGKQIGHLSLPEIEALQRRRDTGTGFTTSPLGASPPMVAIQPPIAKRNTNNQQLAFIGIAISPLEYLPTAKVLYESDDLNLLNAVSRCVGLEGMGERDLRDGILFSTSANEVADAKCQRDLHIQSDGQITLSVEFTNDHELYQICRLLGNAIVLAAYTYRALNLIPRVRFWLKLELPQNSQLKFLPRNWQEHFTIDLANDDFIQSMGRS